MSTKRADKNITEEGIKMRITCLAENTACNGFEAEHGLSLYIETNGNRILFDMGQTDLFSVNAEKLGIDLNAVDFAVISHGHYDHGGGLRKFLEINQSALVYMSRFAFEPHYNGTEKYIGLDSTLCENDRLVFTNDTCSIRNDVTLYSCNTSERKHNCSSSGMTVKDKNGFHPDDFRHEQYLLIEENSKRILISGCSHKGILDIVEWFKPDVLIGGFHFSKLEINDKLKEYALFLDSFGTEFYTCHCTGTEQYEFMKNHMKRLHYLSCGESIDL